MALTNAERQAEYRKRQKKKELPFNVIDRLNQCLKSETTWLEEKENEPQNRSNLFTDACRLITALALHVEEIDPTSETATLLRKMMETAEQHV